MLEVTRCVLLRILEAVEGGLCLLEVMRRVPLCMLEAAEGGLCLLELLEVPEVMRCVLHSMFEAMRGWILFAGGVGGVEGVGGAGGDASCAALYWRCGKRASKSGGRSVHFRR